MVDVSRVPVATHVMLVHSRQPHNSATHASSIPFLMFLRVNLALALASSLLLHAAIQLGAVAPSATAIVVVLVAMALIACDRLIVPRLTDWWHATDAHRLPAGCAARSLEPVTASRQPRRLSNGAAAHMLRGSLPAEIGSTNEIIHVVLRIDDVAACARHFHTSPDAAKVEPASSGTGGITCYSIRHAANLDAVGQAVWSRLSAYKHFRSLPRVVVGGACGISARTEWHAAGRVDSADHIYVRSAVQATTTRATTGCGSGTLAECRCRFSTEEVDHAFRNELLNGHLDKSRPLWDAHLFLTAVGGGGDGDGGDRSGVTIVLRTHHAVADGLTLMHVITSMFGVAELHAMVRPPSAFAAGENGGLVRRLHIVADVVRSLIALVRSLVTRDLPTALYDPDKFELTSPRDVAFLTPIAKSKFDALRAALCQRVGVARISSHELLHALFSFAWWRASYPDGVPDSQAADVAVLRGTVSGAADGTTNHQRQEQQETPPASHPAFLRSTRVLVPFSLPVDPEILHTDARFELLPRNYVSFVSCPIVAARSLDERVRASSVLWSALKRSTGGAVALWLADNVLRYLPHRTKQAMTLELAKSHTVVFSSVAGPQFDTARASSTAASHPQSNSNIDKPSLLTFGMTVDAAMANGMPQAICVGSVEQFTLTLTFNPTAFPQFRRFAECWDEELRSAGLL